MKTRYVSSLTIEQRNAAMRVLWSLCREVVEMLNFFEVKINFQLANDSKQLGKYWRNFLNNKITDRQIDKFYYKVSS